MPSAPDYCPNCGSEVPANAQACPECGADEKTGWSEHAQAERLGIPRDDFNYDEFVEEEFNSPPRNDSKLHWFWWVIALSLIALFLFKFVI